jgi:hypothetical protein
VPPRRAGAPSRCGRAPSYASAPSTRPALTASISRPLPLLSEFPTLAASEDHPLSTPPHAAGEGEGGRGEEDRVNCLRERRQRRREDRRLPVELLVAVKPRTLMPNSSSASSVGRAVFFFHAGHPAQPLITNTCTLARGHQGEDMLPRSCGCPGLRAEGQRCHLPPRCRARRW